MFVAAVAAMEEDEMCIIFWPLAEVIILAGVLAAEVILDMEEAVSQAAMPSAGLWQL